MSPLSSNYLNASYLASDNATGDDDNAWLGGAQKSLDHTAGLQSISLLAMVKVPGRPGGGPGDDCMIRVAFR